MQFLRAVVASTALFACPACVTTDPLRWNYAATVETETGTERFDLGTQTYLVEKSPDGTTEPVKQLFYQWQDLPQLVATSSGTAGSLLFGEPLFSWVSGSGTHVSLTPPTGSTDSRIRIILDTTRGTSGGTETATVGAGPEVAHWNFWPTVTELSGYVEPTGRAAWALGLTPIKVELGREFSETAGIIGIVPLGAEPRGTPEPGTLALAGIGLGLVGLRLRRGFM